MYLINGFLFEFGALGRVFDVFHYFSGKAEEELLIDQPKFISGEENADVGAKGRLGSV